MTKEFMSVAGRLNLWYCGACLRHWLWLSDHPIWRVVIANVKEREIGNTETAINPIALYQTTHST